MERWEQILSEYNVTEEQAVFAAENASQSVADIDSEEWYDVYAASLGSYEEENRKNV